MRPRWVRVRERDDLRRLRAQELRVRAVSMPVRFVRVPIEELIERGVGRVEFFLSRSFASIGVRSFSVVRRDDGGNAIVRSVPSRTRPTTSSVRRRRSTRSASGFCVISFDAVIIL